MHLKNFNVSQLRQVCREIRSDMIHTVSQTGGHLGASLGVVELTVALHKVGNPTLRCRHSFLRSVSGNRLLTWLQPCGRAGSRAGFKVKHHITRLHMWHNVMVHGI